MIVLPMSPLSGAVCIVPALNADRTVGAVIASVRDILPGVIVIGVDDGSTDGTRALLRRVCDHVIEFDENRGKGAALRSAFAYASSHWSLRPILTIDADGQHDTSFAPELLGALAHADIVIGTRQITGLSVPTHRRLANRISSAATRAITRCAISDSQSGYRAMRPTVAATVDAQGDRYEYETDFLVRASHRGYRIAEVAVPTIYGPPSHFRELADALRVARVLWSHRAAAFR
ncbi:MAG: glycosyltransferase family 2 protein [Gemmatimonadaceae bacterium]